MSENTTPKSQTVKWIEPAKQEKIPNKVNEPYEIIIGNNSDIYGFTKTMTLKFETLAEVKTAITILTDIIVGFGEDGAALMIAKPDTKLKLDSEDSE